LTLQVNARRQTLAAAVLLTLGSSSAMASGFSVPELSTAGVGTANAMVANPKDRGAFPFNPSAMAFHEQSSWSAGALFLAPSFSVRNEAGKHDSQGAEWFAAPLFQAALRINDKWSLGFGVNAPFGLETRWESGTFPSLDQTRLVPLPPPLGPTVLPVSPQPTQSKLEILDFVPTVSYRVNDNLAVSAGADIYWVKSATLNSTWTDLEGDGSGVGFNLSALFSKDAFSAGIAFRSAATAELNGFYTALNPTLVAIHGATAGAQGIPPSQTADLDLNLPWRLQLGVRYEITPALAVEVDWTRNGWSEFDKIQVDGDVSGTLIEDTNEWKDSNAYRFGVTYQLLEATQLRFGYSYDEKAQPDDYFSARVPDNDRQLFAVGVGHSLQGGWQVEAGYLYATTGERNVRGVRPYDPSMPGDINGTTALAGKYESDVHMIALEVSKGFDAF